MLVLKLAFLFNLYQSIFCLNNNNTLDHKNNNHLNVIQIVQNTPVESNIPLIIQEMDRTYITQKLANTNPNINHNLIPKEVNTGIQNNYISIKINTTNMDPMCTTECCMGCQIQFDKFLSQKNCIINICKCHIIEIKHEEMNNQKNNPIDKEQIKESGFMLFNMVNNDLNINDINDINDTNYYFLLLLVVLVLYESYILYNLNLKNNKFNVSVNTSDLAIEKDKENRINDYMELFYDDEELIENLI